MEDIEFFLLLNLGKALLLTIVLELIILLMLKEKKVIIYFASVFMNFFTNITLNLLIQIIPANYYDLIVFGLELLIIFIESLCYFVILKKYKKAFKISLLCNSFSYILGLLLMPFIF